MFLALPLKELQPRPTQMQLTQFSTTARVAAIGHVAVVVTEQLFTPIAESNSNCAKDNERCQEKWSDDPKFRNVYRETCYT
jgi:hypothetical protein